MTAHEPVKHQNETSGSSIGLCASSVGVVALFTYVRGLTRRSRHEFAALAPFISHSILQKSIDEAWKIQLSGVSTDLGEMLSHVLSTNPFIYDGN